MNVISLSLKTGERLSYSRGSYGRGRVLLNFRAGVFLSVYADVGSVLDRLWGVQ